MIMERMGKELFLPANHIAQLAKTASHQYKIYKINKHGGDTRTIEHPSRRLKTLQKWLLTNVIETWPVHDAATAYRKGTSILNNAQLHVGNAYLLRMDLKEFFPSLRSDDLRTYKDRRPSLFQNWTHDDFTWFLSLVCRFNRLTIGAPTSPAISNALCFDLDVKLDSIGQLLGVTYTRYADDMFFSTNEKNVLTKIEQQIKTALAGLNIPRGLSLNEHKTRHSSKKGARRVTGIILGSDGKTHVGRKLKRQVRSQVHKLDYLSPDERSRLAGVISYIIGFDPEFLNVLINKYGYDTAIQARYGSP